MIFHCQVADYQKVPGLVNVYKKLMGKIHHAING